MLKKSLEELAVLVSSKQMLKKSLEELAVLVSSKHKINGAHLTSAIY